MRSLAEVLGTAEFLRVRLGVRGAGRAGGDLADYVLEPFAAHERPVAEELAGLGADAVETLLDLGLEEAMNRFNGRSAGGGSRTDRGE